MRRKRKQSQGPRSWSHPEDTISSFSGTLECLGWVSGNLHTSICQKAKVKKLF
jgi:hypothetical protein